MRPQKTVFYFLHGLWTLVFVACVFSSAAHAADLQIVQGEDAYVGQEIVLSLQGSLLSQKPLFEWSVSGDVKSVLLKNGGAEFAFTPINTSAIDIEAVAKNPDGQVLTTAKLGLTPRYFEVGIEKLEDEPLMLWDIKVKEERPTTELASNRPIRFEARLTPSYNGELRYDWTSDASTSILSSDASQTTITRSEIGDSELSVQIVNAARIPLGRASRVVSVTVPSSRIEDSARQKAGWTDWQEAQAQWAHKLLLMEKKAKSVGAFCMDMAMFDATGIDYKEGDTVTILGQDGNEKVSLNDWTKLCTSSSTFLQSMLRNKIPKEYK